MNIKTLNMCLPIFLKTGLPLAVHGRHAIGKTEIFTKKYEEEGNFVVNYRLNTISDIGDIIGLQDPIRDENGNAIASRHLMAAQLFEAVEFCKKNPGKRALILLDEMNRPGTKDLFGPIFQLTLDRKIGAHDFSQYPIDVIALMNFDNEDYDGTMSIRDKALLSRFAHIEFTPSQDEWLTHMKDTPSTSKVVRFLSANPQFIEKPSAPFSVDDLVEPDRRKWKKLAPVLESNEIPQEAKLEFIAGYLGLAASQTYLNWEENEDKVIELSEILNYNKKLQKKIDEAFDTNRVDIIHAAVDTMTAHLKLMKEKETPLSEKEAMTLVKFIEGLPDSIQLASLMGPYMTYLHPILRDSKKYGKYVLGELLTKVKELRGTKALEEAKAIADKEVQRLKEEKEKMEAEQANAEQKTGTDE